MLREGTGRPNRYATFHLGKRQTPSEGLRPPLILTPRHFFRVDRRDALSAHAVRTKLTAVDFATQEDKLARATDILREPLPYQEQP